MFTNKPMNVNDLRTQALVAMRIQIRKLLFTRMNAGPAVHKQLPSPTFIEKTGTSSQATHAYERDTHLHINRLSSVQPTTYITSEVLLHGFETPPNRTQLPSSLTIEYIVQQTRSHCLHKQNMRQLPSSNFRLLFNFDTINLR